MRRSVILSIITLVIFGAILVGCSGKEPNDTVRQGVDFRWDNFNRAEKKYPMPRQENFPMREAMVKYTQRQDMLNHPWYIYVQIGEQNPSYLYYIGQTYPQSTCNFLGSTEDVREYGLDDGRNNNTFIKGTAPSLDGIYYGGGGSQGGGCDYFFFDMATDGMIVLSNNLKWFVSDRVLGTLDARPVRVSNN